MRRFFIIFIQITTSLARLNGSETVLVNLKRSKLREKSSEELLIDAVCKYTSDKSSNVNSDIDELLEICENNTCSDSNFVVSTSFCNDVVVTLDSLSFYKNEFMKFIQKVISEIKR